MNMGSRGSGGTGRPNVHDAKMCCGFCHTVVRFSNTRQNSGSLSGDL